VIFFPEEERHKINFFFNSIFVGSMSSNESVHHEVASLHASTVGTAGSKKSSKSLAILNNALRHATDGFIGVLGKQLLLYYYFHVIMPYEKKFRF